MQHSGLNIPLKLGSHGHERTQTHCGICDEQMLESQQFVTLYGNEDSTGILKNGDIHPQPYDEDRDWDILNYPEVDDNCLFKDDVIPAISKEPCGKCDEFSEPLTVHHDCHCLFKQECRGDDAAMDYMWLNERAAQLPVTYLAHWKTLGIPEMQRLPTEIIKMIRDYSSGNLFWRYNSVVTFAHQPRPPGDFPSCVVELGKVMSWERNQQPVLTDAEIWPSIVRITMDSRGLKRLERFQEMPPHQYGRSDSEAYSVFRQAKEEGPLMQFKYGLARLVKTCTWHGGNIWDTPTPPYLEELPYRICNDDFDQFFTIELGRTTGITFFIGARPEDDSHEMHRTPRNANLSRLLWKEDGAIHAIHAHTESSPSAIQTYRRLPFDVRGIVACFYMPLSPLDPIVGMRFMVIEFSNWGKFNAARTVQFAKKLSGVTTIGFSLGDTFDLESERDINVKPTTLFYQRPYVSRRIRGFGVRGETYKTSPWIYRNALEDIGCDEQLVRAQPKDMARIQIFEDSSGYLRGLLIYYNNGVQKALGQCRFGWDTIKTVIAPVELCFYCHVGPDDRESEDCSTRREESGMCRRKTAPTVCGMGMW
ncbi:hypothetical protein QBC38DRAFT_496493 [Podospora fimiseda]|uniref:Uncharacterized protein n=1 Tax=Podospora fimiseda TaxID=252190 RepID=A0AAN7BW22_9PEZI|nr:hypothetical protein QBC38DRAFT_496493 [Podospora fimiseda]